MSVAAGWYTDPAQSGQLRWWDGQAWTDHTRADVAPAAPVQALVAVPRSAQPLEAVFAPAGHLAAATAQDSSTAAAYDQATFGVTPGVLPSHAAASGLSGSREWQRPVVAVGLVAVLAVAGLLGYRTLTGSDPTPAAPVAHPAAAVGPPIPARQAAAVLDIFKPHDNTPGPGVTSNLIPLGDTLARPTLGGWCRATSHTDKTRVGRRQWVLARGAQTYGTSVEVAAYGTPAQAKAAYNEFVAMTKACVGVVRHLTKTPVPVTVTYNRDTVTDESPASDIRAQMAILREEGVADVSKKRVRQWSVGTVQQRGQFLTIIWSSQPKAYSSSDLSILRSLAHDQATVLAVAPLT